MLLHLNNKKISLLIYPFGNLSAINIPHTHTHITQLIDIQSYYSYAMASVVSAKECERLRAFKSN